MANNNYFCHKDYYLPSKTSQREDIKLEILYNDYINKYNQTNAYDDEESINYIEESLAPLEENAVT